jgi:hypothetical protein
MKYGSITLSSMTYTYNCENKKCNNVIVCIMSMHVSPEYLERCKICQSGRMKRGDCALKDLRVMLDEKGIIHKLNN